MPSTMPQRVRVLINGMTSALLLIALHFFPAKASAAIAVKDDAGGTIALAAPARRIVTLAPHTAELIYAGGSDGDSLTGWRRFPRLTAVQRNNLFSVNSSLMTRAGPRILDGTEILCRHLESARQKRK
jgi:ABC-type Fe3+-hydroxamate transport system substrate-binding protein